MLHSLHYIFSDDSLHFRFYSLIFANDLCICPFLSGGTGGGSDCVPVIQII